MNNSEEYSFGTSNSKYDSDGDGFPDGFEMGRILRMGMDITPHSNSNLLDDGYLAAMISNIL